MSKPIASKKLVRDRSMSRSLSDRQSAESVERSSLSQSSVTSREGKSESKLKGWTSGRLNKGAEGTADSSSGNDTDREARKERRVRVEERKADGPPSSSRDAAGMNFSERMSSMFAAASNTLRPSSAKRDEPQRYNLIYAKHRAQENCMICIAKLLGSRLSGQRKTAHHCKSETLATCPYSSDTLKICQQPNFSMSCSLSQTAKPALGRESAAASAGRQLPSAKRTTSGDSVTSENGRKSRDHRPTSLTSNGNNCSSQIKEFMTDLFSVSDCRMSHPLYRQ